MRYAEATLPWNTHPVLCTGNLRGFLMETIPTALHDHVPELVTICCEPALAATHLDRFVDDVARQLAADFARREQRRHQFIAYGLFSESAWRDALTPEHAQPWVIYYSASGGLNLPSATEDLSGVVPCSSMPNHGVAWKKDAAGKIDVWLVTDRKAGQDWDWDSDIGHESAHARFAPVPLFSQSFTQELNSIHFLPTHNLHRLSAKHLARMCYLYTELAVVAVRGEERPTATRLPLAETDQLLHFLKLSHQLMPDYGFDRALSGCRQTNGVINIHEGAAIFDIGAAALRAMSCVIGFIDQPDIAPVAHEIFGDAVALTESAA